MLFQITEENIGRNGLTKRDIGKWCVMVQGCPHIRKTYDDAKELLDFIK